MGLGGKVLKPVFDGRSDNLVRNRSMRNRRTVLLKQVLVNTKFGIEQLEGGFQALAEIVDFVLSRHS
jgi:hypothetical protein